MTDIIFIFRSSLRPESRFWEGLRMSAAFIGMDYIPLIVFMDESIQGLKKEAIQVKLHWEYLKTSADLAGLYVLENSLIENKIKQNELDPDLNIKILTLDEIAYQISKAKVVTTF